MDQNATLQLQAYSPECFKCPKCLEYFAFNRSEESANFPLLLSCNHNMCYSCVYSALDGVRRMRSVASSEPETMDSKLFKCLTCKQPQETDILIDQNASRPYTSLEVITAFPLDLLTIGWLAAFESVSSSLLPMVVDDLDCQEADFVNSIDRIQQQSEVRPCPTCHLYSEAHSSVRFSSCKGTYCYRCVENHSVSCPTACEDDLRYHSADGTLLEHLKKCSVHGEQLLYFSPSTGDRFCVDCLDSQRPVAAVVDLDVWNTRVLQKIIPTNKFAEDILIRLAHNLKLIQSAPLALNAEKLKDIKSYVDYFSRLISSFQTKSNNLLDHLQETDGKRLDFLENTTTMFKIQDARLESLEKKMHYIVTMGSEAPVDFDCVIQETMEEMNHCFFWNRSWLTQKRLNRKSLKEVLLTEDMAGDIRNILNDIECAVKCSEVEIRKQMDARKIEEITEPCRSENGDEFFKIKY